MENLVLSPVFLYFTILAKHIHSVNSIMLCFSVILTIVFLLATIGDRDSRDIQTHKDIFLIRNVLICILAFNIFLYVTLPSPKQIFVMHVLSINNNINIDTAIDYYKKIIEDKKE